MTEPGNDREQSDSVPPAPLAPRERGVHPAVQIAWILVAGRARRV